MDTLSLAIMGAVNIICFVIGAKVGQTAQKGEDIRLEIPTVRPAGGFKQKRAEREEQDRMETIMHNIEAYDGTSLGQREVK